jgi:uncharacterized tellurite resistance protein B-like protein
MGLLRFLGLGGVGRDDRSEDESDTVREIASRLERLEPDQARFLASFAYVLARLAHADLHIDANETAAMERAVREVAHLSEAEAALVVQIAQSQAVNLGGTQDYLITRQFRQISTREQRGELLACLYAVAAADGTIGAEEGAEIVKIGEELGFTRAEANSLRGEYREKLSTFRG